MKGRPWLLPERMRALRKEKGMTLTQLAEKTGYCISTMHCAETGVSRTNMDTICCVCAALGTHPSYLLGFSDEVELHEARLTIV